MTAATVQARKSELLHIPLDLQQDIKQAATDAGLSWQEWCRGCFRRELARIAAEKPKKGRK